MLSVSFPSALILRPCILDRSYCLFCLSYPPKVANCPLSEDKIELDRMSPLAEFFLNCAVFWFCMPKYCCLSAESKSCEPSLLPESFLMSNIIFSSWDCFASCWKSFLFRLMICCRASSLVWRTRGSSFSIASMLSPTWSSSIRCGATCGCSSGSSE